MTIPLAERLDCAVHAARAAGYRHHVRTSVPRRSTWSARATAPRSRSPIATAERVIREAIAAAFPDDAIIGEEHGITDGTSGVRWILDPIDGTTSFVHGVPLFGTLIGIEDGRRAAGGRAPHARARRDGVRRARTRRDARVWRRMPPPRPARVSSVSSCADAMLLTTSWTYFRQQRLDAVWDDLMGSVRAMRGWSDCYAALLVATGRAEAMVEPILNLWDVAALVPLIVGAGGRVSDWRGGGSVYPSPAILSNGAVHDELVARLRDAAPDA